MTEPRHEPSAEAAEAVADLAARARVPAGDIEILADEAVTWPDASLGCPKPGRMYAQVLTPGRRVALALGGTTYEYHAGNGRLVLCEPR